jgi:hypothetical protein
MLGEKLESVPDESGSDIGPFVAFRSWRDALGKDFTLGCYNGDFEVGSTEVDADDLLFVTAWIGFLLSRRAHSVSAPKLRIILYILIIIRIFKDKNKAFRASFCAHPGNQLRDFGIYE